VQATLYKMAQRLLELNGFVQSVTYTLPNKHYIPVDLKWASVDNLTPYVSVLIAYPSFAPSLPLFDTRGSVLLPFLLSRAFLPLSRSTSLGRPHMTKWRGMHHGSSSLFWSAVVFRCRSSHFSPSLRARAKAHIDCFAVVDKLVPRPT
jgi:hypothetical protein